MSSSRTDGVANDSVICLDSSIDENTIQNDNETDNSATERINLEKTLPPGVAPDGFIILDEIDESEKTNVPVVTSENTKKDEEQTKPMFKIVFRDETVVRLYKKRVQEFFQRLINGETRIDNSTANSYVLEVWSKKKNRKRSIDQLKCENIGGRNDQEKSKDDDLFRIEKRPMLQNDLDVSTYEKASECKDVGGRNEQKRPNDDMLFRIEKRPMLQDSLDVPTYGKKFKQILDSGCDNQKAPDENNTSSCPRKVSCFNCMGDHSIRDCLEPRNHMEIAKNRQEFTARSAPKGGRYHVENGGQKFGQFVPGQISQDLKRALGIKDNQLPQHIYRMRILGYPPGWLKEARVQHSGMNLYNSDGAPEGDLMDEPGEIVEFGDKDQYDVKKIHQFPGFNVKPPSGTREEDKRYWKSERYVANSKESLLAMIKEKKFDGYKKKKLSRFEERSINNAEQTAIDMDIVEILDDVVVEDVAINGFFIPPLPKSPAKQPLPPGMDDAAIDSPVTDNVGENAASPGHSVSPPLEDLEQRKKQLLAELDDSSAPLSPSTPVKNVLSCSTSQASCSDENNPTVSSNGETSETDRTTYNSMTPIRGMVKSVDLGTPLLETTSPYSKLPAVENFAKDVCDIIHFENLPDATGKYEQMSGILQKVRTKLAQNQQESQEQK